jgi:cyclase
MTKNLRTGASVLRLALALLLIVVVGTGRSVSAQQSQNSIKPDLKLDNGKLEVLHVQGNVYMIAGAGANVTVQVGSHFVIVVDPGRAEMSEQVLAAIRSLTTKQGILFIIDTCADPDHTGGNEALSKAGWLLPNGSQNPIEVKGAGNSLVPQPGASILAHENVLTAMSQPIGNEPKVPSGMWPTDAYDTELWRIYNDEGVFMYHPPAAHSNGDTFVLFRGSDVLSAGDLVNLLSYPVINVERGGSINGLIDALNQMIDLMEPKEYEEGGTYLIPGHGHIGDRHDVVNYRDMVTIIRDRIRYLIGQGKTLEQVKAEKPTFDYDVLYGTATGPWTTDTFIETIYRELSKTTNQKSGGGRQ